MDITELRSRLRTVQLVPLTAFDANDQLAVEPMRALLTRLVGAGIRCFIPCAGSAEFHSLSGREIEDVISLTRDTVGDESLVMAPIGHRIDHATAQARSCHEAGADAVLVMPLNFPYLSNTGARDYYRAILDESACPVLMYKKSEIPSDELLLELADHPQMVGVKYAVNDLDAFNQIVQRDGGRIEWICGSAERFAPFFALAGAVGYTSGAGNLCPHLTLAMFQALSDGDYEEALRVQRTLLPIEHFRARDDNSFNISFLKHGITLTGLDFGPPRPPQRQLTDSEKAEAETMLQSILEAEAALSNQRQSVALQE